MCPYVVVISWFTNFSSFTGFISICNVDVKIDYKV